MSSTSEEDPGPQEFNNDSQREVTDLFVNDSNVMCIPDIDVEGFCHSSYNLEQYVQGVYSFSSQYGIDYSISYTANNICGRPSKYPDYGDFPETFAMRTYGNWWNKAPSRVTEIQPQNLPALPAHDFIVVYFEDYIIPNEIVIYETFNPGALIRIWAYTIAKTWVCLWEIEDFHQRPTSNGKTARRFAPPLKKIALSTRFIRLEFNHSRLNYFTEIDAVLLSGRNTNLRNTQELLNFFDRRRKSSILRKVQNLQIRPLARDKCNSPLQEFVKKELDKFLNDISLNQNSEESSPSKKQIGLESLPFEIMLNIFSMLDLVSLFRVGQVSRYCYDVSTHPLLYTELNLKPYWHLVTNDLLCTLACRATVLKKLDLSWCGLFNTVSATEFKKFVQQRGDSLTHLRLNSCTFLNASCIETVGIVCDNLRELSLRNCDTENPLVNFSCLGNLKNLERLDLFQTMIEGDLLLTMLESNRQLKHINLAFAPVTLSMDEVAQHIATYNQEIVSIDLWKSHYLSASGIRALSTCQDLEELDIGWCLREASLGDSLRRLVTNCPKLKKLFLATIRGITDLDVEHIANTCHNLEQLDLMGVLGISKERYHEILVKCKKLQLLDLSFCDNITDSEIALWSRTFNVSIKCSHVPQEFLQ